MPSPPSLRLSYGGLRLSVTADAADVAWLDEFVRPWFTPDSPDGSQPDATVTLISDPPQAARLLETTAADTSLTFADVFVLDSRVVRHPAWRDELDQHRVADRELQVVYIIRQRDRRIEILSSRDRTGARVALMRVVRELAMAHAAGRDGLLLHAAAADVGGRALVVAGPKRAGKTTLLLHILQTRSAGLIANDRVCVEAGALPPRIIGVPSIVSLREGTLALLPNLRAKAIASGYRFWHTIDESRRVPVRPTSPSVDLTPAQLCDVAGVVRVASASLTAVLFPEQGHRGGSSRAIARLSTRAAAERLRGSIFGSGARGRRTSVFAWTGQATDRAEARCDALARLAPAFACRVDSSDLPNTDRAQALVDELLAESVR